ncbi:MAG: cadmium-translocating P-type ATPase [Tannerella sp.]|jgi:Cu+-exporting ATPase|nr:cadmium-translocating P-type ATPase [Tannerella sp.]
MKENNSDIRRTPVKTVSLKVHGMSCAVCASHVKKTLESGGAEDVSVNFATGDVTFQIDENTEKKLPQMFRQIEKLGYTVAQTDLPQPPPAFYRTYLFRFLFCACFTLPLLLHMVWPDSVWANPRLQFLLSLPVYLTGLISFGKPAVRSLLNRMPDMNVLILLGATAAYAYSLTGMILYGEQAHHYLFFESSASIVTLILLGRFIEEKVVEKTSSSIADLVRLQKTTARKILFNRKAEKIVIIDNSRLQAGDRVLINAGDQVPADGCIVWGEASVNEAMLTGESDAIHKRTGEALTGGALLESGTVKMRVTAVGRDTALAHIIELVKRAQNEKTAMQQLADRISAVFVPVVLLIAFATFFVWYLFMAVSPVNALMYGISVAVIACPCAMGLATPLALMVGMGRAAKNGILIKGMQPLEACTRIRQIAFDKTGTLTTGEPVITAFASLENREDELKSLAVALEKHSSHPVARCITKSWKDAVPVEMASVTEIRGKGISGRTADGAAIFIGAAHAMDGVSSLPGHSLYITRDRKPVGWIDLQEEVRPEAQEVIEQLKRMHIRPVIVSGDQEDKCRKVARKLGIETVYAGQTPEQKPAVLKELMRTAPTAMVGDGINDAPALATAHLGISLSDATRIAMQQADILLLDASLKRLPLALGLGKHTFVTIRENLFWAFIYNVIAIPVAACGFLTPTVAAASMALSDVFLLANSMRLKFKKVI